jgi:p-aminobenzoyl-glutamate transporter AbgT
MIGAINKVSMTQSDVLEPLMRALIATVISSFIIVAVAYGRSADRTSRGSRFTCHLSDGGVRSPAPSAEEQRR